MQTLPVVVSGQQGVARTQTASGPQSSLSVHSAPHSEEPCHSQMPPPSVVVAQKHVSGGCPRREQSVQGPPGQQASPPAQVGSGFVVLTQTRRPPPGGR